MKKYRILGLALFAVFALSAIAAMVAYAEEEKNAEWLSNGAAIAVAAAATVNMEVVLTELVGGLGFGVLCSVRLDGTVGPGAADLITEMLNLSGEAIGELTGTGIICTPREGCEAGTDAAMWPELLPWETLLTLMANGSFLDHIHIMLWFKCLVLNVDATDLCEGVISGEMLNVAGGVEPMFSAAAGTEKLDCTTGGVGSGTLETESTPLITLNGGQTLTVSE